MSEAPVSLYLVLLFFCLLLSAFFSSSEASLLSIQQVRLQGLLRRRVPGARRVARVVEHPERFLPTILLGNNLVNTAAAVLGTALALTLLTSERQAVLVATILVTALLLVFGEVIPKTLAVRHAERLAVLVLPPLETLRLLLFPLVILLQGIGRAVSRPFGGRSWQESITEEEVKAVIALGRSTGAVEGQEAEMLERVFRFGDHQVREVMTPRTEVVWVEQGTTLAEFLALYARSPYSRFPVYAESPDNVVGILSVKDVLGAMARDGLAPTADVTALGRPAFFVPEAKLVSGLLREFQASQQSIAVVVDEWGGVDGVATLTQLLEVVVGPVAQWEGMPVEEEITAVDGNTFEVNGGVQVEEVNRRLDLAIPEGEYETIAGFILDALGHIPQEGEECEGGGATLRVIQMESVKIEKVRVRRGAERLPANGG